MRASIFSATFIFLAAISGFADTLSTNLSNTSAGTETATATTWLAASFGTQSAATLDTVSLLLSASTASVAELDIYSNGLLAPDSFIGKLSSTTPYSSALSVASFSGSAVSLAPNTTYWLVLKAVAGQIDWSWTANNSGSGSGFQGIWGLSSDSGATWYTYTTFPFQFSVTTVAAASPAVPEPSTAALLVLATTFFAAIAGYGIRKTERNSSCA